MNRSIASTARIAPTKTASSPSHICGLVLALLWTIGCAPTSDPVTLLDVDAVAPEVLEPGTVLHIDGGGFPVSRDARVQLVGELARPGQMPLLVDHVLRGHAVSDDRIECTLRERDLMELGGRGTFNGEISVIFAGISSRNAVRGVLESIELDLRLSPDGGLRDALERGDRAEAALEELGIVAAEEQSPAGGLQIGEVRPLSPAAHATLAPGDVLVRFDGVRVLELADVAPRPGSLLVELEVERPGLSHVTTLRMPLRGPPQGQKGRVLLLLLMLGALIVFAAWVPATSGPFLLFARDAAGVRPPHPVDWLLGAGGPGAQAATTTGRQRRRLFLVRVLAVAAVSSAFAGMAIAGRVFDRLFDTGALTGLALMLRLAIHVFGGIRKRRGESPMRPKAPRRSGMLNSAFVLRGAPMTLTVVAVLILGGTNHLRGLQVAQGAALWDFMIFRHPVAFLLFPVFAVAALGGPSVTIADPETPVFAAAAARAHLLVVAALGTVVFLGGWHPVSLGGSLSPQVAAMLGVVVFVLKCWALMLLGLRLRLQTGSRGDAAPTFLLPTSIMGVIAALAWVGLGVPSDVESMSGPVLLASMGLVALITAVRRWRGQHEAPQVHLHPFL